MNMKESLHIIKMTSQIMSPEKGQDGEGYYFVNDEKLLPVSNKLLYCPYCGDKIKQTK